MYVTHMAHKLFMIGGPNSGGSTSTDRLHFSFMHTFKAVRVQSLFEIAC